MTSNDLPYADPSPEMNSSCGTREWLDEQVQRTPWWAISLAMHLLVVAVFMGWTMPTDALETANPLIIVLPTKKMPEPPIFDPPPTVDNARIETKEPEVSDAGVLDPGNRTPDPTPNPGLPKTGASSSELPEIPQTGKWTIGVGGPPGGGGGNGGGGPGFGPDRGHHVGAPPKTVGRVMLALEWLARHQGEDGMWRAEGFSAHCHGSICEGKGNSANDVGVTGLALLAFLGAGYTHRSLETCTDPHQGREICLGEVVKNGIRALVRSQDSEGCFGGQVGGKYMYNHAIATLAIVEAYGLTDCDLFRDYAQRGIDFLVVAQNPYKGWRYTKRCGDNDTSVTGWAVMALKSAKLSHLVVSSSAMDGALAWVREATDDTYFKTGYTAKGTGHVVTPENEGFAPHEALTAVGMLVRMFAAGDRTDMALEGGAKVLVDDLPAWDPAQKKIDYYYWYYASLALYQFDGPKGTYWSVWNRSMLDALLPHQRMSKDDCAEGSWDADTKAGIGRWCYEGGRVYATAINALTLEVYYRYPRVFGGDERGAGK